MVGRYVVSASAIDRGAEVVFHDTESPSRDQEQCNVDQITGKNRRYFWDPAACINLGYRPCEHCLPNFELLGTPIGEDIPADTAYESEGADESEIRDTDDDIAEDVSDPDGTQAG